MMHRPRRRGLVLLAIPVAVAGVLVGVATSASPSSPPSLPALAASPDLKSLRDTFMRGEYRTCEDLARFRLKNVPHDPEALMILAQVFRQTNRPAKAATALLQFAQSPQLERAQASLALPVLRDVASKLPKNPAARKALALGLARTGALVDSLQATQEALRLNPADPELNKLLLKTSEQLKSPHRPDLKGHLP